MAAGLGWELGVVLAYFAVFVAGLSYAQWQTRGMKVYREEVHQASTPTVSSRP